MKRELLSITCSSLLVLIYHISMLQFRMDPRDFIVVLDTWLKNMESNVHQIRAAVKTLCDHAIFDASTKMVLPDALNINESLRYSNVFRG